MGYYFNASNFDGSLPPLPDTPPTERSHHAELIGIKFTRLIEYMDFDGNNDFEGEADQFVQARLLSVPWEGFRLDKREYANMKGNTTIEELGWNCTSKNGKFHLRFATA